MSTAPDSVESTLKSSKEYLCCRACGIAAWELKRPLSQCARCRAAHYCSKLCQRLDWRQGHAETCLARVQFRAALQDSVGSFEADLTKWVRQRHMQFASLALRLMRDQSLLGLATTVPATCVVRLLLQYDASRKTFHVCTHELMSLSEASRVYQDESHQAIADGLATQLPGSVETGRIVWAMIVAECSHGACSMKRLVPQTWTPAAREDICAEASLKTLPSIKKILRAFESADL